MVLLSPAEIHQGHGFYLSFLCLLILFVSQLLLLASFSYDNWQKSERTNQALNVHIMLVLTHPLTFNRPKQTMWWNSEIHETAEIWLAESCSMVVHRWCSGWFFILRVKNWKQLYWILWKNSYMFEDFFLYVNIFEF